MAVYWSGILVAGWLIVAYWLRLDVYGYCCVYVGVILALVVCVNSVVLFFAFFPYVVLRVVGLFELLLLVLVCWWVVCYGSVLCLIIVFVWLIVLLCFYYILCCLWF